jgi:hypothetical protein
VVKNRFITEELQSTRSRSTLSILDTIFKDVLTQKMKHIGIIVLVKNVDVQEEGGLCVDKVVPKILRVSKIQRQFIVNFGGIQITKITKKQIKDYLLHLKLHLILKILTLKVQQYNHLILKVIQMV